MKKIVVSLIAAIVAIAQFPVFAGADAPASSETESFPEIVLTPEEARYYAEGSPEFRQKLRKMFVSMLETDGYKKAMKFFKYMELQHEEEIDRLDFSEEQLELLKSGKNVLISVTAPRTTEKFSFLPEETPDDYDRFYFVILLDDGKEIVQPYHLNDNPYMLDEIIRDCGISDPEKIGFLYIQMGYFYFEPAQASISVLPCESGWNEIDGARYYVKKDGTFATGTLTVDGSRYKFDQNGVCQGKYTGFTNSSKGRQYWKNGELVKNKWIKVKGERKYYAGEDGYLVTGTKATQG